MNEKVETPELDKMVAHKEQSQTIGTFLDWLGTREYDPICLCYWDEDENDFSQVSTPINSILAEYLGIDEKKAEAERQALLDTIREEHKEVEHE